LAPLQTANFDLKKSAPPHANFAHDFFNLDYLLSLFHHCALASVIAIGQDFQQKLSECDGKFDEALNVCSVGLCNTVRIHTFTFMLGNFVHAVASGQDPQVKDVLTKLCAFFACVNIIDDPIWIGRINAQQLQLVKQATLDLLEKLRPDAVPLVDAFEIPDRALNSTIGRFDGNVYEALYSAALQSPLNQVDPFDGYKETLQPYLDLEFLQRGNKIPPPKVKSKI